MDEKSSMEESEKTKHRFRVREILLDKGILAVVLALLAFFTNARLAEYKAGLDVRLDELRASRERQRVIAEREVTAYEDIWKALIQFRRELELFYDKSLCGPKREPGLLCGPNARAISSSVLDFEQAYSAASIYLAKPLRVHLDAFVGVTFPEAFVKWEHAKGSTLPPGVWNQLTTEMNSIGEEIRGQIYSAKPSGDDK